MFLLVGDGKFYNVSPEGNYLNQCKFVLLTALLQRKKQQHCCTNEKAQLIRFTEAATISSF